MDDQVTKLYVAYFHRSQVELAREVAGPDVEIITLDELDTEASVRARIQKERESGQLIMSQELEDALVMGFSENIRFVVDPYFLEPQQCGDYEYYKEPLPKPIKQKLNIKQAPRQSFRQSMRSVNRNR